MGQFEKVRKISIEQNHINSTRALGILPDLVVFNLGTIV